MREYGFLVFLIAALLAVGLVVVMGCGDDDDDDNDDNDVADDDDNGGGAGTLSATVRDFQTKQSVQGALVQLVDNTDGSPLGAEWQTTSPSDGKVSFSNIPEEMDLVGVKVSKTGNKDTYQFDFVVGATDEEFLLVSETTASLVALSLGVDLDPAKGFAAGGIYWGDPTDENPVGCAEVTTDPEPEDGIYYFGDDGLPNTGRNITTPGDPANGQGVNPDNGYWVAMNMPTGEVDITATSGTISESSFVPRVFPDSVCIANVYFSKDDYSSNPQEDWCTE